MLKVGIIGLGGNCTKSYLNLSIMANSKAKWSWHLYTRNRKASSYWKTNTITFIFHYSIEALIESGIEAAFVHTATNTHALLVKH